MVKLKEEVKTQENDEIITIIKDKPAKMILFGNPKKIELTRFLVSLLMKIPYEELGSDSVTFLKLENANEFIFEKETIRDVALEVKIADEEYILIVEFNRLTNAVNYLLNNKGVWKELKTGDKLDKRRKKSLRKNFYYLCKTYATQLREGEPYSKVRRVILFNLNTFSVNSKCNKIKSRYAMTDFINNDEFSNDIEMYNINLVIGYKKWYNNKYQERSEDEKDLILLSALLLTDKIEEAYECINQFKVDDTVKNMLRKEIKKMQNSEIRLEAIPDVEVDPKKELDKLIAFAKSEAINSFKEEGLAEGREENQREVILNSYKKQLPLGTIAEICGVSERKVKSIVSKYYSPIK